MAGANFSRIVPGDLVKVGETLGFYLKRADRPCINREGRHTLLMPVTEDSFFVKLNEGDALIVIGVLEKCPYCFGTYDNYGTAYLLHPSGTVVQIHTCNEGASFMAGQLEREQNLE